MYKNKFMSSLMLMSFVSVLLFAYTEKKVVESSSLDIQMKNLSFDKIKNIDYDLGQEEVLDGKKVWHYIKRTSNSEINMYMDKERDVLLSFEVKETRY